MNARKPKFPFRRLGGFVLAGCLGGLVLWGFAGPRLDHRGLPEGASPERGLQTFGTALVAAANRGESTMLKQTPAARTAPPELDRVTPERTETALFALG